MLTTVTKHKKGLVVNALFVVKTGWKATAIGKNMKNAKTFLEKRYNPDRSI